MAQIHARSGQVASVLPFGDRLGSVRTTAILKAEATVDSSSLLTLCLAKTMSDARVRRCQNHVLPGHTPRG